MLSAEQVKLADDSVTRSVSWPSQVPSLLLNGGEWVHYNAIQFGKILSAHHESMILIHKYCGGLQICLDEAQMVECTTTKVGVSLVMSLMCIHTLRLDLICILMQTAEMALRLSAVNRWCVTGTPIQRSIDGMCITSMPWTVFKWISLQKFVNVFCFRSLWLDAVSRSWSLLGQVLVVEAIVRAVLLWQ